MDEAIYALVDPRDHIEFYVGRTQDTYRRFIQHISYSKSNDAKSARIREMKSLHLLPIMKTLEIVKDDPVLSAQREAYWIKHFKYLGIELTNGILYSAATGEEQAINTEKWGRSPESKTKVVKMVDRILRRNPKITAKDLAFKIGISESYASKLKARFGKKE